MGPRKWMSLGESKWTELFYGQWWSEEKWQPTFRDRHWPSQEYEQEIESQTKPAHLPQPSPGYITNLCFPEALGPSLPQTISHPEACLPPGSHLAQALLKEPASQSHSQGRGWIILFFCSHI